MPTYEYVCLKCRRHTEAVQRFSDPPLTECPHCGGPLKRVFHPVGIVLKGSGFYSTDNRSGKPKSTDAKPSETKTGETSTAPESKPAESKPAASKESKPGPSKKAPTKK
jgi:putative FmdB family regulatory protein